MKKYLMSLAALMITLSATVLTSCNPKNEPENVVTPGEITPEPGTHVETLTIAFPEQEQTRVAIDGDHNLTGWEQGDEVTLVRTYYDGDNCIFIVDGTYTFTCTNAANGTFTGTMPNGYTVNDCQLAFYNATGFDTDGWNYFYFSPKTRASQYMKDVVMLVAKNDGEGNFEMEIFGSILQVTNNTGADITASVKYSWFGDGWYYDYNQIYYDGTDFYDFRTSIEGNENHQITLSKDDPTYVFIPVYNLNGGDEDFAVGLSAAGDAEDECSIVPFKTNPSNHKLFKKTLTAPTTGTAKATIEGNEVDVNWVQLWAGGPKFAEYNVGASSSTDIGAKLTHTAAISDANSWGANWCIPSKDDMDELQKAANFVGSTKLTCETVKVNDTFGFKFTGIGDYAENSVFFPGESRYGKLNDMVGIYWSNTSNDDDDMIRYWYVYLEYIYGNWTSVGDWGVDQYTYFVRPVLNN